MSGKSARAWVMALSAAIVLMAGGFAAAEEKTDASLPPGQDPRDVKAQEQLDLKVSFDFNEQPVVEAFDFLRTISKANIVVDRKKIPEGKTVTLALKDTTLGTALKFLTEMLELKFVVRDGVVFVSDAEGVAVPPVRWIYDVADLLKPRAGMSARNPEEALNDLIETIKQTIASGTWDEGSGNAIRGLDGDLILTHTPAVHREVQKFLADLRKIRKADAKPAGAP